MNEYIHQYTSIGSLYVFTYKFEINEMRRLIIGPIRKRIRSAWCCWRSISYLYSRGADQFDICDRHATIYDEDSWLAYIDREKNVRCFRERLGKSCDATLLRTAAKVGNEGGQSRVVCLQRFISHGYVNTSDIHCAKYKTFFHTFNVFRYSTCYFLTDFCFGLFSMYNFKNSTEYKL